MMKIIPLLATEGYIRLCKSTTLSVPVFTVISDGIFSSLHFKALKVSILQICITMRCSSFVMIWDIASLLANKTLHLIIIGTHVMTRKKWNV